MNKEEALNEFLKGLRIVINNASAYPKEHPYFIKSVDIFRKKAETLFQFLNPIKINIAPDSLFMDRRYLGKAMLYVDLASMFHIRKIKSIEFRQGLNNEELVDLLSSISLPIKEILRKGGIQNILNNEKTPHVSLEELDYSELLRDEGEEAKDIWVYLFKAAVENEDLAKINAFAENFGKIINKFRAKDVYEDPELRQNLYNFLSYLKGIAKDKFYNCSKDLLRLFLKDQDISQEEKFEKIRIFFQDFTNEDLTDALIDSISKDEDFNNLSFTVFSRLFEQERHKKIAPILERRIRNTEALKNDPRIRKKIKEIFSVSEDSYILPLYRQALHWLCDDQTAEARLFFDHDLLQINYCFLLLNLLAQEKNSVAASSISGRLLKECDYMIKGRNWRYLKSLSEVLDQKLKEDTGFTNLLEKLQDRIVHFIENEIFEEEQPQDLEYFVGTLSKSYLGLEFYLGKIFKDRKINSYVLKLLLKLFPDKLRLFYENLEKVKSDIDFLAKIVKSFEGVESSLSVEILKRIFYFSSNIIRMEVLKSMQSISSHDKEFLLFILKKEDFLFKRQALLILARDDSARRAAMDELFCIRSPLGIKNKILIENMMVIESLEGERYKEAGDYLTVLSKKRFFWNKNIREKAIEVLKKLNARTD